MNLEEIRRDYQGQSLDFENIKGDPLAFFDQWLKEAIESDCLEPTAMNLMTHARDGYPDGRIVLLKKRIGDYFVFFTNYKSEKGKQIQLNNKVCLNFFWPELARQVRIKGLIEKTSDKISDDYFQSRPRLSQIGAIASDQSEPLSSREKLDAKVKDLQLKYPDGVEIDRPAHWGGYQVYLQQIEFWQGRSSRLHDRILLVRNKGGWLSSRLSP